MKLSEIRNVGNILEQVFLLLIQEECVYYFFECDTRHVFSFMSRNFWNFHLRVHTPRLTIRS